MALQDRFIKENASFSWDNNKRRFKMEFKWCQGGSSNRVVRNGKIEVYDGQHWTTILEIGPKESKWKDTKAEVRFKQGAFYYKTRGDNESTDGYYEADGNNHKLHCDYYAAQITRHCRDLYWYPNDAKYLNNAHIRFRISGNFNSHNFTHVYDCNTESCCDFSTAHSIQGAWLSNGCYHVTGEYECFVYENNGHTYDHTTATLERRISSTGAWTKLMDLPSTEAIHQFDYEDTELTRDHLLSGVTYRINIAQEFNLYPSDIRASRCTRYDQKELQADPFFLFVPNSLQVEASVACGQNFQLSWEMEIGDALMESSQLSHEIVVEYKSPSSTIWEPLQTTPTPSVSNLTNSYQVSINITDLDLSEENSVDFRVRRDFFEANVTKFIESGNFSIPTQPQKFVNADITTIDHDKVQITWAMDNSGYACNSERSFYLIVSGEDTIQLPSYNTNSYIYFVEPCHSYDFQLWVRYNNGTNFLDSIMVATDYVISGDSLLDIRITASTGYYSEKVRLQWVIPENSSFSSFKIFRKELGSTNEESLIYQMARTDNFTDYTYDDYEIEFGKYYKYKIYGYGNCSDLNVQSTTIKIAVGFAQPYGTISGNVSFGTGQAIAGTQIIAENDDEDLFINRALYFPGDDSSFVLLPSSAIGGDDFTFQAWIRRSRFAGDSVQCIFHAFHRYALMLDQNNHRLIFAVHKDNDSMAAAPSFSSLSEHYYSLVSNCSMGNDYTHVSATVAKQNGNLTLTLYINGVQDTTCTFTSFADPNIDCDRLLLGTFDKNDQELLHLFSGFMDEIRFWNRALDSTMVSDTYDAYLNGKETGLSAYYHCDEPVMLPLLLYDLSATDNNYNRRNGFLSSAIIRVCSPSYVPGKDQLAYKTKTNTDGFYLLNTIPFSSIGCTYSITPTLGTHEYQPSKRQLYVSNNAHTFNDIDFTDISSFDVSGCAFYKNTNVPVVGALLKVDGVECVKDETIVVTDQNGAFNISVPVGEHYISIEKEGHVFENDGRYPADPEETNTTFNFMHDVTNLTFTDNTVGKIIGRVVGGDVETQKPLGFGKSNANIGKATIQLQPTQASISNMNANGMEYSTIRTDDDTLIQCQVVVAENSNIVEITTDENTGEFSVWLPPFTYKVISVKTQSVDSADFDLENIAPVDLPPNSQDNTIYLIDSSNIYYDTLLIPETDSTALIPMRQYDTISCNAQLCITYYNPNPTFLVTQETPYNSGAFGDSVYHYTDQSLDMDTTIRLFHQVGDAFDYTFDYPVFIQDGYYTFQFQGYETYLNADGSDSIIDQVPLQYAYVTIDNGIGTIKTNTGEDDTAYNEYNNSIGEIYLDSAGKAVYTFFAGLPNLADNQLVYLNIAYFVSDRAYEWQGNGFAAYVLGEISTGNDFITGGPDEVIFILRDPPGSNSYAYIEDNTTTTETKETTSTFNMDLDAGPSVQKGTIKAWEGGHAITHLHEIALVDDVDMGFRYELISGHDNKEQFSTTTTKRITTSSSSEYVGSKGDIFIGSATNIVYGEARGLGIYPDSANQFSIQQKDCIIFGKEFTTTFNYTQEYIINTLLPHLEMVRNSLLQTVPTALYDTSFVNHSDQTIYITTLTEESPKYGSSNNDSILWGEAATDLEDGTYWGPSYILIPPATSIDSTECNYLCGVWSDSINWYNESIRLWKNYLAENEETKLTTFAKKSPHNISFDAGSSVSYTSQDCGDTSYTRIRDFLGQIYVKTKMGFNFEAKGVNLLMSTKYGGEYISNITDDTTTCTNYGTELSDEQITDYFSVDVFNAVDHYGLIFRTLAGASSCPYEEEELPQFYTETSNFSDIVLNNATMQVDVPSVSAPNTILTDIPSGETGIFEVHLSNLSEADVTNDYIFRIISASNVNNAIFQMNGISLVHGVTVNIGAGQTLIQNITVTQPRTDVINFENVQFLLLSSCQYDPVSHYPVIADTLTLSAYFTPSCSPLHLEADRLIINKNSASTINLRVTDFDTSFFNLGAIRLQYKGEFDVNWTLIKEFVVDENIVPLSYNNELLTSSTIDYSFDMSSYTDQTYQIRAITVCQYGIGNFINNESETIEVVKDIRPPTLFGLPTPTNGLLTPNNYLSVAFNEDINTAMLNSSNFSIQGQLNGYAVDHNVGLNFDGTGEAHTTTNINLSLPAFTIEGWINMEDDGIGTLFSHDNYGKRLIVRFTDDHRLTISYDTVTITSDPVASYSGWQFISISFNAEFQQVSGYLFNDNQRTDLFLSTLFPIESINSGILYLGNTPDGTDGFRGIMHHLRLWNTVRTISDCSSSMNSSLSGTETGLIGYWPMEEASGNIAYDKARNRHLSVNTDWYLYPSGKSLNFDGSNKINFESGQIPLTSSNDFTVEFWFKGGPQSSGTLFSCGHGINDDNITDKLSITTFVDGDNNGLLLRTNGYSYQIANYCLDHQWHHFALSVNRQNYGMVYLDGENVFPLASDSISGIANDSIAIGCCRHYTDYDYVYDEFFTGNVDEVRIWNAALTQQHIVLQKDNKLSGNETGLMVYFPMEYYYIDEYQQWNIMPTLSNQLIDDNVNNDSIAVGDAVFDDNVPPIKDERPVEDVNFDWSYTSNSIAFNITEDIQRIENCTLTMSVDDIYDTHQNKLESSIKWTALVQLNTLKWTEDELSLQKKMLEDLTFSTHIANISGELEFFEISQIPNWLTVSDINGYIDPLTSQEINFTVSNELPIGIHETQIMLTGNNEISEILNITVKVIGITPGWEITTDDYTYTMNVVGQIELEGIHQRDTEDSIAAFINGEIRGVASPQYETALNQFYVYMTIYGNRNDIGQPINYSVWDASKGTISSVVEVTPEEANNFTSSSAIGSIENPAIFNIRNISSQQIQLQEGWNWISTYIEQHDNDGLNHFFQKMGTAGEAIKSQNAYLQYSEQHQRWFGNLNKLENEPMYMLKAYHDYELSFNGDMADPINHPIAICNGWNWIGYLSSLTLSPNNAFAGLVSSSNDKLQSAHAFASYSTSVGWMGNLDYMMPGQGYLYQSQSSTTDSLFYPTVSTERTIFETPPTDPLYHFDVQRSAYPFNMILTGELADLDEILGEASSDSIEIGAFAGDECRGSVMIQQDSLLNKKMAYLLIMGNLPDSLTFRLYNHSTQAEISTCISPSIVFEINSIEGTPDMPYPLFFDNSSAIRLEDTICQNDNYSLHGFVIPSDSTQTIGTHYFTNRYVSSTGCDSVVTLALHVKALPDVSIIGNYYVCEDGETVLTATGGSSYLWNTGATTASITITASGNYSVTAYLSGCSAEASHLVVPHHLPPISILGDRDLCLGDSTTLSVPGDFHFQWSTGDTTSSITMAPEQSGIYRIVISDTAQCSVTEDIVITVHPLPQISISGNTNLSSGGTAILNATGGSNYVWSTGEQTPIISITPDYTQIVSVIGRDQNQCASTASVVVQVDQKPFAIISGQHSVCRGDTAHLSLTRSDGSPFDTSLQLQYAWNTGENTASINVTESGDYTVVVTTMHGFSFSKTATVVVHDLPTISITGDDEICQSSTTTLHANGGESYEWSTGALADSIVVAHAGNYYVTGYNTEGCRSYATANVVVHDLPMAQIVGNSDICQGDSVTLSATNGSSWEWSTDDTTADITVHPTETTIYSVVISDIFGCQNSAWKTINVHSLPIVSIVGDTAVCQGEYAILTAFGGNSYEWSNGIVSNEIAVQPISSSEYTVIATDTNGCQATSQTVVNVHPLPIASITGQTELLAGESTTLTANGGNHYLWSTGDTTASITITPALSENYSVVVYNEWNCSDETSVTVTVDALPVAHIDGARSICAGDSTLLTATGGIHYLWNTGDTTASIYATAGHYYVVVTDQYQHSATDSAFIVELPLPSPTISGKRFLCAGESALLWTNNIPAQSYLWSTGSTENHITVNETGNYSVMVTNIYGCSATVSTSLTVFEIPTITILGETEICHGSSTVLVATGAEEYVWSSFDTTDQITVSPSESTNYFVSATDSNGCHKTQMVHVEVHPLPNVEITGNHDLALGDSTILTASGGIHYLWSTNDTTSSITIYPESTAVYSVMVTDNNGCYSTADQIVTINSLPLISIMGDTSICQGESAELIAFGGESYVWNTGANVPIITVTETGWYSVTGTDDHGFSATTSLFVTVHPRPIIQIEGDDQLCQGESTTLTATGGCLYLWNTGDTVSSIIMEPETSSRYLVFVKNEFGCLSMQSIEVAVHPLPTVSIVGETTICEGQTSTLSVLGNDQYVWSSNATTPNIEISEGGNYFVQATNEWGCEQTDSIFVNQLYTMVTEWNQTACDAYTWNDQTYTQSGVYVQQFQTIDGCDSMVTLNLTIHNSAAESFDITACDAYTWNDQTYTQSGVYVQQFQTIDGCDSMVTLNLTIHNSAAESFDITACDAYTWNDQTYTNSGAYVQQFQTIDGCDSIVTLNLTIHNSAVDSFDITACDAYTWNDQTYTQSGVYVQQFQTIDGCDSMVTLNLTIHNSAAESFDITACDAYTWNDQTYTQSGAYVQQFQTIDGCDSMVTLNLTIHNSAVDSFDITACDAYTWNDQTYTQSGVYVQQFQTIYECDSMVTLNLTIHNSAVDSFDITACDAYTWNDQTYTQSGAYVQQFQTIDGCDSMVTLNLTIHNSAAESFDITACDAYTWNDQTYTQSGVYIQQFQTIDGCDSMVTLHLTIHSSPIVTILGDTSICQGNTTLLTAIGGVVYEWSNGDTTSSIFVNETGSYSVFVINENGCTATASATVTIHPLPNIVITGDTMLCAGESTILTATGGISYQWSNGSITPMISLTPTSSTTLYTTVFNEWGCSRTQSVSIVVHELPNIAITGNTEICSGDSTQLIAVSGYDYQWSTGDTTSSIFVAPIESTHYSVVASDAYGCSTTELVSVLVHPRPEIYFMGDTIVEAGSPTTIIAFGGMYYVWLTGETTSSITVYPYCDTTYSVFATDNHGCSTLATFAVFVHSGVTILEQSDHDFLVYPNPANQQFTVEGNHIEEMTLYNILGQRILEEKDLDVTKTTFSTSNLESGVYSLRIKTKFGQIITKQVIIIH